jgi:hypothetical protein
MSRSSRLPNVFDNREEAQQYLSKFKKGDMEIVIFHNDKGTRYSVVTKPEVALKRKGKRR